jgi:hypothetical protein
MKCLLLTTAALPAFSLPIAAHAYTALAPALNRAVNG